MAAFRFAAVDNLGKESSGVLEADSARLARQLLRGRGLIPLSVDPVMTDVGARAGGLSLSRRLSQTELAVITRQLASLLGAQLPVSDALTVMVEQSEKQSVRELMASIRTDVLGGTSLSKALVRPGSSMNSGTVSVAMTTKPASGGGGVGFSFAQALSSA